jgi:AcrR family transcriptional regulator
VGPRRRTEGARKGARAARVISGVLRATLVQLGEVGYVALRIEDVAHRARVNKTTIYRRWPTKQDLVRAAITTCTTVPVPDTGSLERDLVAMGKLVVARMRSPEGAALMRIMVTDWQNPDILDFAREMRVQHEKSRVRIVDRAIARGELPKGTDAHLILDAALSPLYGRLKHGYSVDARMIERLARLVLVGARHGGAVPARASKKTS